VPWRRPLPELPGHVLMMLAVRSTAVRGDVIQVLTKPVRQPDAFTSAPHPAESRMAIRFQRSSTPRPLSDATALANSASSAFNRAQADRIAAECHLRQHADGDMAAPLLRDAARGLVLNGPPRPPQAPGARQGTLLDARGVCPRPPLPRRPPSSGGSVNIGGVRSRITGGH